MLPALGSVSGLPALLMDYAYEGDRTWRLARALGYEPIVLPKSNRGRPSTYSTERCRRRNEIKHLSGRLKRFRRIGTRYDKLDVIIVSGTTSH